jgi:ATP-dependent DNA helicase RecG
MPIAIERISNAQAERLTRISEGQFSDAKAIDIAPAKLTKHISAFANTDGGELYIGLAEVNQSGVISREWSGFADQEAANGHLQIFDQLFPLGTDFQYEFLACDAKSGLVLHTQINKTQAIMPASNGIP